MFYLKVIFVLEETTRITNGGFIETNCFVDGVTKRIELSGQMLGQVILFELFQF